MTGVRRRRRRCRRRTDKVSQSYISRTVWPRITKFHLNLHAPGVYNSTGYDVTMCFRSEVIDVRKGAENDASDGFKGLDALAFARWPFIKKLHFVIRFYFYLMSRLHLLCPDIGSHDYVNQFRSYAITSFIIVHWRHRRHTIFLDDKFGI